MNSRFESEAFGSQPIFYETEEEARRSRRSSSRPRKPPARRKPPVKGKPRPGVKFPILPLAFPVWHGLIPPPAQEPRGQEPRKDAGPSGTPPPPADSDQVRDGTEYVRWVQNTLNQVMSLRLPVNGIMGPETRSAIRGFQTRQGLPADGIVSPQTEAALIAVSGQRPPQAPDAASELEFDLELTDAEWQSEVNRSSRDYIKWVWANQEFEFTDQETHSVLTRPVPKSIWRANTDLDAPYFGGNFNFLYNGGSNEALITFNTNWGMSGVCWMNMTSSG
ncbi:MAG: peptidoglycan-binding protein [Acidobacteria bacterium]|nr:peptidoglycan-binding protein [Acidobacteriota bacterium]